MKKHFSLIAYPQTKEKINYESQVFIYRGIRLDFIEFNGKLEKKL